MSFVPRWLQRAVVLAALMTGCGLTGCGGALEGGPTCTYDAFEGTCRLTNLWVSSPHDGSITIEAQYETPRDTMLVRHEIAEDEAERLRRHLARHPRLSCRGRAIATGSCDPSALEVDLPPLEP